MNVLSNFMARVLPDTLSGESVLAGARPPSRLSSRQTGLLLGMLLLALASAGPMLSALVGQWRTVNDNDYCFVVALICLVWCGRELARLTWRREKRVTGRYWFGATLVALCALEYVLTQGLSELGAQMLIPPILWATATAFLGLQTARPLAAPIFYFYFAVPVWEQALPLLQQITIHNAKWSMQMLGIAAMVDGNRVSIAEGTFEVLYACSGLRYLVVSLALATLMASMDKIALRKWPLLLASVAALSVFANGVRIFIVMYAGHVTGMKHYFVSDNHKGLGNVIFVILMAIIFWLVTRLGKTGSATTHDVIEIAEAPSRHLMRNAVLTAVPLLAGAALMARALAHSDDGIESPQLQPLALSLGRWQGPLPSQSNWLPAFEAAADSRRFAYQGAEGRVEVYLNVYGRQHLGHELVFFSNTVYAPGHWQWVGSAFGDMLRSSIGLEPWWTEQQTDRDERWLVGQLYVVGRYRTSLGLFEQALYGLSTIGQPATAGTVALAIRCNTDCASALRQARDFWREQGDSLIAAIPQRLSVTEK